MISQFGSEKTHMCTSCNAAAIKTRNIFKRFGLTFLPITGPGLRQLQHKEAVLPAAAAFLHPFADIGPLGVQFPPEIIINTCISENVVH
jgi:hypothetical protein